MSNGRDVSVTEQHGQLDGQAILAAINGTKAYIASCPPASRSDFAEAHPFRFVTTLTAFFR